MFKKLQEIPVYFVDVRVDPKIQKNLHRYVQSDYASLLFHMAYSNSIFRGMDGTIQTVHGIYSGFLSKKVVDKPLFLAGVLEDPLYPERVTCYYAMEEHPQDAINIFEDFITEKEELVLFGSYADYSGNFLHLS